ncbi:MAG TPA: tetratricopeptide repeat protein [Thermoanaerobaculia bacterium]|nr:tetratricopeptide repeat protein [Thermoanaerobaculia bacterium]
MAKHKGFRLISGNATRAPREADRLDSFLVDTDPFLIASLQQEEGQRQRKQRIWGLAGLLGLAAVFSLGLLGFTGSMPEGSPAGSTAESGQVRLLIDEGIRLTSEDEYAEAMDRFRLALELAPGSADAWAEVGNCHLHNFQTFSAEEAFQRALALDPDHSRALRGLGTLYMRRGEERKAEQVFLRIGESLQLARLYLLQGRFDEAAPRLAKLVEESPDKDLLHRMAQAAAARELPPSLRSMLEPAPTGRSRWADLGWRLHMEERYEEAADAFGKAVAMHPDDVSALSGLGLTLLDMNRAREGRTYFERALAIDHDHLVSLNGLANCLKVEGQTEEAIAVWHTVSDLYPGVSDGTKGLAWTYYERGDYSQAAVYFAQLATKYPNDTQAIAALNVAVEKIVPGRQAD